MGVARSIPARAGKPDASRGAVATYYGRLGGGPSVYEPLGGFPLIAAISRPPPITHQLAGLAGAYARAGVGLRSLATGYSLRAIARAADNPICPWM